jgi:hypothetical protein
VRSCSPAFAFPALLGPLNRIWLKLGLFLHKIVSPIVLGIMFFFDRERNGYSESMPRWCGPELRG